MKLFICLTVALFFGFSAHAQEAVIPSSMSFWLYPDHLNGARGRQIKLENIRIGDGKMVGTLTMYGKGRDRCELQNNEVEGVVSGKKMSITTKIKPGDNLSCPMNLELSEVSGGWEGTYRNAAFGGRIRRE